MRAPCLPPCFVVAVLSAWAAVLPRTAAAHAPARSATRGLDVRVEATLGEAERRELAGAVRDALVDRLAARGIEVSVDAPTTLVVAIERVGERGANLQMQYTLTRAGDNPKRLRTSVCASCTSTVLVGSIDGDLEPLWSSLEEAASGRGDETPSAPIGTSPPSPVVEPKPQRRLRRTIGGLGLAGAGVGAIGLGVLGAGAVMWGIGYSYPENNPEIRKNLKMPGIAMVAVGGAMTIAGIAMLAVDLTRDTKGRRVAAVPILGRRSAGVSIAVRW